MTSRRRGGWSALVILAVGFVSGAGRGRALEMHGSGTRAQATRLAARLDKRIPFYDCAGRPLVAVLLDLAYAYRVPMGIEYVDREAALRPLHLKLRGKTVGEVIGAVVASVPPYRVSFDRGLAEVFSPIGRASRSNLLNTVIRDFTVRNEDTHRASADLGCAMARTANPAVNCFSSIVPGEWGAMRISLDARGRRVYEILEMIVAANGSAVWTVIAPAEQLSTPGRTPWYIYPLGRPLGRAAVESLEALYPQAADADGR